MWSPALAEQLRRRGHDAVSVLERPHLVDRDDTVIFEAAQEEGRAVFTDNIGDFVGLATDRLKAGGEFDGLVLTSNATYPRGHPGTLGRATRALDEYLKAHPGERDCLNQFDWLPSVD